jgi:hypothetical protein
VESRDDLPEVAVETSGPAEVEVRVSAGGSGGGPAPAGPDNRSEEEIKKEFLDDPLIRKALDIFRGEIEGIEYPNKA